ncbi:hypothetical protein VOLCADRAFT_86558 [Volvox carteri f. nagariensis]|uniref:Uncharacterized protein n=1 Tax=Volvox carteri f. nagariensis TaxID=3068 RepID=D8TJ00_VOLCA|nr:uncharacterized protein VOLCADRAFT_86558 [Volvox carteri f. nagariensis]EFJ52454.1 hypothetical protein VOLCADRAFT_86558 [Volvox carteri f. nagariensis]|eukprot:XP_002946527.1 hypothetical protein VOLCADRAFT_86558 [Volvox carteri f. nagariensis]
MGVLNGIAQTLSFVVTLLSDGAPAIHDAFAASALVGGAGLVECWLDPGELPQPPPQHVDCGSRTHDCKDRNDGPTLPAPGRPGTTYPATNDPADAALITSRWLRNSSDNAAGVAVALAHSQLLDWANTLSIPPPGNLVFRLEQLAQQPPPAEAFHLAAVSSLPVGTPEALASTLQVLYAALKMGGELFVSVLLCNRRLCSDVSTEALEAVGVGPVMYFGDFVTVLRAAGFRQPRVMRVEPWDLQSVEEEAQFMLLNSKLSTFQIRAQKNRLLDDTCEDYGQWVVYKGTLEGSDEAYTLDMRHRLVRNQPILVCGNTAAMLGEGGISWLSNHFIISGERSVHYGPFTGGPFSNSTSPDRGCCCL